jgi:hypothetical protein
LEKDNEVLWLELVRANMCKEKLDMVLENADFRADFKHSSALYRDELCLFEVVFPQSPPSRFYYYMDDGPRLSGPIASSPPKNIVLSAHKVKAKKSHLRSVIESGVSEAPVLEGIIERVPHADQMGMMNGG